MKSLNNDSNSINFEERATIRYYWEVRPDQKFTWQTKIACLVNKIFPNLNCKVVYPTTQQKQQALLQLQQVVIVVICRKIFNLTFSDKNKSLSQVDKLAQPFIFSAGQLIEQCLTADEFMDKLEELLAEINLK